jgi:chromosome segregation ATPase
VIINFKSFKTMSRNAKTAAVKGRETKLNKKSNDELIQIILKKDKIERNLNNQIKSLKGEVNTLSTRVNNFDKDMEGTMQTLETYKDKCNTLQEKNDGLVLDAKNARELLDEATKEAITLGNKANMWKVATYAMTVIAVIAVLVAIV